MQKNCLKCNQKFIKRTTCSRKEWSTAKYCSQSCANSANVFHNSLQFKKGHIPWNKNKKMKKGAENSRYTSIEKTCLHCENKFNVNKYRKSTALFCSRKCVNDKKDTGKTSINIKIRRSVKFRLWRKSVFKRDNYTCQKCLIRGGELNPHHILNFSDNEDKRFDINNGITLCRECHYSFHREYGYIKNNTNQMKFYLKDAIGVSVEA